MYGMDKVDVDQSGAARTRDTGVAPGHDDVMGRTWGGMLATPVRVTQDGQVVSGRCMVVGFVCTAGTTPTLALYDGTGTSGTLVYGGGATETAGSPKTIAGGAAVECASGLYADVGGTNPAYTVYVVRP